MRVSFKEQWGGGTALRPERAVPMRLRLVVASPPPQWLLVDLFEVQHIFK